MPDYRIAWIIDLDATSPEEAAKKALAIQRDPDSIALVFEVREEKRGKLHTIDLANPNA